MLEEWLSDIRPVGSLDILKVTGIAKGTYLAISHYSIKSPQFGSLIRCSLQIAMHVLRPRRPQ